MSLTGGHPHDIADLMGQRFGRACGADERTADERCQFVYLLTVAVTAFADAIEFCDQASLHGWAKRAFNHAEEVEINDRKQREAERKEKCDCKRCKPGYPEYERDVYGFATRTGTGTSYQGRSYCGIVFATRLGMHDVCNQAKGHRGSCARLMS